MSAFWCCLILFLKDCSQIKLEKLVGLGKIPRLSRSDDNWNWSLQSYIPRLSSKGTGPMETQADEQTAGAAKDTHLLQGLH